jgi:hypothetical protein
MPVYFGTGQRLRQKVRRVFRAEHLKQAAHFGPNKILHPELGNG